ncbi:PhnD/SsuA/transferrin family substrate-binding protein [Oceanobacillus profundus]|uniref:Phosphonate ABC transporter substrate-binding protein n=1 Tax=Oceanobacillus profundus TaxID=372463 RepID=A0A417YNN6_9BACI|nr:PhnD/SsuA/transferrin family substrate-binding protein [Oceanobacillus profundus]MDO6447709.1 PhnD/SsuA/transferrin family substrate-binding protein [Oceanobacillus profundus]RHW35208.1 phosphonate ABC transporter substrate-binding protein [Oceanobacillus profundus]
MKKNWYLVGMLALVLVMLAACSGGTASGEDGEVDDVIDIVWYPNESGNDMKSSRDEIGRVIEEATDKEVEHHLTTDYAIAIETLVNNNADVAFMGAVGYIEAKNGNDAVEPLVVPSGESGTLDDAIYYSWLAVNVDEQDNFKVDGEFSLDTIADKPFSFVSNSSTSGFVVPSSGIIEHFSEQEEYADLTGEDLMEGGPLFSQVLFGGSHQGSAVNLLNNSAEVAAFCDTCVENYVELVEGEANTPGAVYRVKDDAAEPFNTVAGKEFVLMSVTPVLNAPFAANMDVLGQEDFDILQELFSSDEIANNEQIFVPEDSGESGLFFKSGEERFIPVEDSWFDPIRELSE